MCSCVHHHKESIFIYNTCTYEVGSSISDVSHSIIYQFDSHWYNMIRHKLTITLMTHQHQLPGKNGQMTSHNIIGGIQYITHLL